MKKAILIFTLLCIIFSLSACGKPDTDKTVENKPANISLEAYKDEDTGLYGYKDKGGTVVIPCTFEKAGDFKNERALVKKDSRFGYIDTTGNIVIPCIYKEAGDFSSARALVRSDGKLGFIDTDGNAVTEFIFDNATNFNVSGYATVFINGESYDIDKQGNKIVDSDSAESEKNTEADQKAEN